MNESVTLPIPEQFLKDVLVTICETPGAYGIHYWATIGKITKGTPTDYTEVKLKYDLREKNEGNQEGRFTMGLAEVALGIRRCLTTPREQMKLHPANVGRVAAALIANDAGEIDGEAANWIAQAAIFDEQVYS